MDQRITDLLPAALRPDGTRVSDEQVMFSQAGEVRLETSNAFGPGSYFTFNTNDDNPRFVFHYDKNDGRGITFQHDIILDTFGISMPNTSYADFLASAGDSTLTRKDYLVNYVSNALSGATSGFTANTSAIQALQAKGGYNRGAFTASTAYKKNDIVVFNGLIYYANADFTSTTGFVAANWTFMGTIITQDQALMLRPFVVSYDKNYGYDTALAALGFVNSAQDTCGVVMNGPGFFTGSLTMNAPMFFQGNGNRLSFSNNIQLTMNSGSQGTRLRDCYISINTDAKIVINSGGVEYTCTSFDNVVTQGSNSSVDLGTSGILALRGNSNIHKVTGSGTLYLFDHSRVVTLDSTVTVIDRRTANTPPSTAIKNAVKGASASSWNQGELQGTQPAGSVVGMRFVDASYRYEYMGGKDDTTGTTYVWTRTQKA